MSFELFLLYEKNEKVTVNQHTFFMINELIAYDCLPFS